jgi:hypothetical protein
MASLGGPNIITNGLVLSLDAANNKSYPGSGTTWSDLSGNNNNGTLTNGPTFNSQNGGNIVFDGVDDWVTISPGSNFAYDTGDFTLEAWVKPNFTAPDGVIYAQTVSGTNYFICGITTSSPYFIATSSGAGTVLLGPSYTYGNWTHVVFSRISGVIYSYTNAISGNTQNNTINLNNTTYVPTIGDETNHGSGNSFKGNISTVRIYKGKGLTMSEVTQNYNAQKSRFGL